MHTLSKQCVENNRYCLSKRRSRFGSDAKEVLEAIKKIRVAGKRVIFEENKIDTKSVKDEILISIIEACE